MSEKRPNPNFRAILRGFGPRFSSLSPHTEFMVKIVVCIKQVPERDARLRIASDGKSVDTAGVATEINESDQYALEAGLRLAETEGIGGEVVVACLGSDLAEEAIRRALAMGAARAIHLSDPAFQGGDAAATGRALAAAIEPEKPDLVMHLAAIVSAPAPRTAPEIEPILGYDATAAAKALFDPKAAFLDLGFTSQARHELNATKFSGPAVKPLPLIGEAQAEVLADGAFKRPAS